MRARISSRPRRRFIGPPPLGAHRLGEYAAIFWNTRRLGGTPFLTGYERLLEEYGTDYAALKERHPDARQMHAWFGGGFVAGTSIDHGQSLDFEGLRGRL